MGIGADEAGRGALVGPMVIAAFEGQPPAGVRDSKLLSSKRRMGLFPHILRAGAVRIRIIPNAVIDKYNLNEIEARVFASLVQEGIVDSPEPPGTFLKRLRKYGSSASPRIHADRDHKEVAAASIVAKVVRDRLLEEIRAQTGLKGSGYPSDPKTRKTWRKAIPFVRKKWKTVEVTLDAF